MSVVQWQPKLVFLDSFDTTLLSSINIDQETSCIAVSTSSFLEIRIKRVLKPDVNSSFYMNIE